MSFFNNTEFPGKDIAASHPSAHKAGKKAQKYQCKFGMYNLEEETDVLELEAITTDAYNTSMDPNYSNPKWVIWEKSFLSGETSLVALKYVQPCPNSEKKQTQQAEEPQAEPEIKGRRRRKKRDMSEDF